MNQAIETDGTRKYRTEIPNLADDELDPYQYRLYAHYKRVCGDNGLCWESLDTTSSKCKMSRDKVIQSRKWLCDNGWIMLKQKAKGVYSIKIVNRWGENCELFTSRNIDYTTQESTVRPVDISTGDTQLVDISTGLSEKMQLPVEISTDTSRNIDTKKELYKKEQILVAGATSHTSILTESESTSSGGKKRNKKNTSKQKGQVERAAGESEPKQPTEHQMMFEKVCQIVGWDWKTLGEKEKGQVAQTLGILKGAGYTLDELNRFGKEVWAKDWRWTKHKQFPTLSLLRTEIGKLRQEEKQKDELKSDTDAVSWKNIFAKQDLSKYQWGVAA